MAKLIIVIPDGDTCERCPYVQRKYEEDRMQNGIITNKCLIFHTKLERVWDTGNKKELSYCTKCDECYLQKIEVNND